MRCYLESVYFKNAMAKLYDAVSAPVAATRDGLSKSRMLESKISSTCMEVKRRRKENLR